MYSTPLLGQMILYDQEAFLNPPPSLAQGIIDTTVLEWFETYLALYIPLDWGWQPSGLSNWTIPTAITPNEKQESRPHASFYSFDKKGFAYFPRACAKTSSCPIHVVLHGCLTGKCYKGMFFFFTKNNEFFVRRKILCW